MDLGKRVAGQLHFIIGEHFGWGRLITITERAPPVINTHYGF
jgi:hypothetical protein